MQTTRQPGARSAGCLVIASIAALVVLPVASMWGLASVLGVLGGHWEVLILAALAVVAALLLAVPPG